MNNHAILINTCDKFEDCWDPFFKLFSIYWPNFEGRIYLNTEYKDYSYPGLNITTVKGCLAHNIRQNKRATWSQCLKWALESIPENIILYMQEDYFIKDFVKSDIIDDFFNIIYSNPEIKCIHLTDQALSSNKIKRFGNLEKVNLRQKYRVSCQAALWDKAELKNLVREWESAWEFEEFGSKRSAIIKNDYYVVSKDFVKKNEYEIIPYVFTGIVQGRWFEEVVEVFNKHNINIDFSKRGFVSDAKAKPFFKRVSYRINKIPKQIRNNVDLLILKYF